MSAVEKKNPRDQIPSRYKMGQLVRMRGHEIDRKIYEITEVLADRRYRLLRHGHLETKAYYEEDLFDGPGFREIPKKSSNDTAYDQEALYDRPGFTEFPSNSLSYKASRPKQKAKSSSQASRGKANRDKTRLPRYENESKMDDLGSIERAVAAGPFPKPINKKASEFDRNMAHAQSEADGPKIDLSEIRTESIAQEPAENIRLAIGRATELGDREALIPEHDDAEIIEEASAEDEQSIPLHSRDEAKMKNIRSMLSHFWRAERPLEEGKKRIRWRCGCGRSMYDDFTELRSGAAAELEKWLYDSMRKHAGPGASDPQRNATPRSATSSNAGSSGYQQTAESDISLQPLAQTANTMPGSNGNAAVTLDVHLEKCWLIICGNMMRGPNILLKQLNLSSTSSDKSLFNDMKDVYSSLRKVWSLRSLLRGVKTIRFVQFQLHKSARVDIRKAPDMPPETRRDEYLYEPCDLIPPVGETFMTHWFHHPEEAWELPWAYSLFPKRRKGELEVNLNHAPTVGWGIQIVEGWLGARLWLLSLSLFLCGSLAFAICWTILRHDIQGAFGVSAYVIALLTLAVGAAQANLG